MINAIGAQFKNKISNNKNQALRVIPQMPQLNDSVSFSGKLVTDKVALNILENIFEIPFEKQGAKFLSKLPFLDEEIGMMKQYYHACALTKKICVGAFYEKKDLGIFAKNAYMLSQLDSMVFLGAGEKRYAIKDIGALAAHVEIMPIKMDKISATLISDGMKEALNKEFLKSDVIKTKFRSEKFELRRELLNPNDAKSPMRYLSVEKIEN